MEAENDAWSRNLRRQERYLPALLSKPVISLNKD
jgi:hypothetical protein